MACQIVDAVFPGDMPMSKVRWDAKDPASSVDNYKLVQKVFAARGVDKFIDVEKLMRA